VGDLGGKDPAGTVPFDLFLEGVRSASYRDYAGHPATRARDQQAFEEMRNFLLARYQGAHVVRSYAAGGAVFDCIERVGAPADPPAPASAPAGSSGTYAASGQTQACPDGTVPVRRLTLHDLVRFATLRQYLAKGPGGPDRLPPTSHNQLTSARPAVIG
jgi:hypothetical protein